MAKRANGDASRFEQLRAKTITITDGCGGMQCNAHKSTTDTDGLADAWGLSVMLCRPYIRGDAQASGYKCSVVGRQKMSKETRCLVSKLVTQLESPSFNVL